MYFFMSVQNREAQNARDEQDEHVEQDARETDRLRLSAGMDIGSRLGGLSGIGSLVLLVVFVAGLYWEISLGLVQDWWNNDNYTHGFVVPVFSGWIAWQQRAQFQDLRLQGSWFGLVLLLAGLGILVLGEIAAEEFLMRSSLIVVICGLIVFHLGMPVLRVLFFPLAYLFFMIPLPATLFQAIAFPLQGFASQNATWTLDVLGVPVLRDGNIIHLSHLSLGVTEACSGIRSLMTLLALAVAWAYVSLPGAWSMLILVTAAIPITIIANAGRVILTGLVGQWFGMQYAQGFFHSFSGWVIFVVAFIGLWGVQSVLWLLIGTDDSSLHTEQKQREGQPGKSS